MVFARPGRRTGKSRKLARALLSLIPLAAALSACSYSPPTGGYNGGSAGTNYTLTVQSGGFGTTAPSGMVTVAGGTAYSISATPSAGYNFCDWKVTSGSATFGSAATSATNMVTITGGNATIQANFILNTAPACTS